MGTSESAIPHRRYFARNLPEAYAVTQSRRPDGAFVSLYKCVLSAARARAPLRKARFDSESTMGTSISFQLRL